MSKNMLARVGATLGLMAALLIGVGPAAQAAQAAQTLPVPSTISVPVSTAVALPAAAPKLSVCSTSAAGQSSALPVNRWQDATSILHSRLDGGLNVGSFMGTIHRDWMIGTGMAFGNFVWSQGANLAEFAISFCMLDKLGGAADDIGATIGELLIFNPAGQTLLLFILVGGAAAIIWKGARTGNIQWSKIAQKGVILALLGIMTAGSMASTGGTGEGAAYKPGIGSPGWIVTSLNNTVASLASAPAMAFSMAKSGDVAASGPLSCATYADGLNKEYVRVYGSGTGALAAGVPLVISGLWERSGLETWKTAQFGTGADLVGEQAWCRLLEWNAGSTLAKSGDTGIAGSSTVRRSMHRTTVTNVNTAEGGFAFIQGKDLSKSLAFNPVSVEDKDRSLIAWSACKLKSGADPNLADSWNIASFYKAGESGVKDSKIDNTDCQGWWTGEGKLGDFNWDSNKSDVVEQAKSEDLKDFVLTLHGNNNGAGTIAMFAYVLAALGMIVVFGGIALAVLIAKIAQTLMIITLFFTMITMLMPNANMSKLGSYFKNLVGITVFIFGMQLIFALVSQITNLIQKAGGTMLGDGIFNVLWTGMSPLVAVVVMHLMFTKVMKVPSPFSLTAGLAWGAAAGAGGAAALGGVSSMLNRSQSRLGRKAAGSASRMGRNTLGRGLSAVSGGKLGNGTGRSQSAVPQGAGGAKAGQPASKGKGTVSALELAAAQAKGGDKILGPDGQPVQGAEPQSERSETTSETAGTGTESAGTGTESAGANTKTGIDGGVLAHSGIANSQLAQGKMSREARKDIREAQSKELAEAKASEKQRKNELGLGGSTTLRGKALDGISNAWNNNKSPKKIAKGVVIGAGVIAAAAVVPWAVPAVVGMYGVKAGSRKVVNTMPKARRERNDTIVESHRAGVREQAAEQKAAERDAVRDYQKAMRKQAAADQKASAGKPATDAGVPVDGAPQGKPVQTAAPRGIVQPTTPVQPAVAPRTVVQPTTPSSPPAQPAAAPRTVVQPTTPSSPPAQPATTAGSRLTGPPGPQERRGPISQGRPRVDQP